MRKRRYYLEGEPYTLFQRAKHLVAGKRIPRFPESIVLETVTTCNARCVFCAQQELRKGLPSGKMSDALFEKIVDECAGHEGALNRISFAFDNEPLLDRDLVHKVARVRERVPFATTNITTNGILLDRKTAEALYASGAVDEINVSVQSIHRETYERLTGVKTFDKVMANMAELSDVHARHAGRKPVVEVNTCLTPETIAERTEATRRWSELGFRSNHMPVDNRDRSSAPTGQRYYEYCRRPFHTMVICFDGVVPICCADYARACVVGDVSRSSLADVWNGAAMRKARLEMSTGRFETARICEECWMSDEG